MIVFGGQNNANLGCGISSVNTGRRYEPDLDTWNPMADAPLGSSLSGPAAIWSGDRMITWLDDVGGRYDPVMDLWQGVSSDMDRHPDDCLGRRFCGTARHGRYLRPALRHDALTITLPGSHRPVAAPGLQQTSRLIGIGYYG
jgi:hypothetical protein